jgi:outer membrane protein assembly factor BamB
MPWNPVTWLQATDTAIAATEADGNWVFRGQPDVFGWREEPKNVRWRVMLPSDKTFGNKCIAFAAGVAVTFEDRGPKKPALCLALEPKSGRVTWRQEVPLRPVARGLVAREDSVILKGNNQFVELDARSGRLRRSAESRQGADVVVAAGRIFVGGRDGLHATEPDSLESPPGHHRFVSALQCRDDDLYFARSEEENGARMLCLWDADSLEQHGQAPLTMSSPSLRLVPGERRGRVVALLGEGRGIVCLDLLAGTTLWAAAAEPGWTPSSAVSTPHGFALLLSKVQDKNRVLLFDEASGEPLSPPPYRQSSPTHVYWMGERILVSGQGGLESFSWGA